MGHIRREGSWLLALGFLLGVKDGYLAVWKDQDPQPVHILSIEAASLPPSDQLLLRKGLHAADPQELLVLLEDYW